VRSIPGSKEFVLDLYQKQSDGTNTADAFEKVLRTIMVILGLIMAAVRMDAVIERHTHMQDPRNKITLARENTKNNPGQVKPISNYIADGTISVASSKCGDRVAHEEPMPWPSSHLIKGHDMKEAVMKNGSKSKAG
jgi:hypothetical protein